MDYQAKDVIPRVHYPAGLFPATRGILISKFVGHLLRSDPTQGSRRPWGTIPRLPCLVLLPFPSGGKGGKKRFYLFI